MIGWTCKAWVAAVLACAGAAGAQMPSPAANLPISGAADPASIEDVLRSMSRQAAVIFVGTVQEVRRRPGSDGAAGTVEIEFRVEHGIRRTASGSSFVLREWAGLWESSDERYRAGQHLLMLLYAPSASGLSSPVGGTLGAIPILPGASVSAEPLVDLRWVATRVSRGPVHYRADTPRVPRARPTAEQLHLAGTVTPVVIEPTSVVPGSSTPAQCASVTDVIRSITAWGGESR